MKYKNDSADDLWLPGIGEVKAGATIETEQPLNNGNFSLVTEKEPEGGTADDEVRQDGGSQSHGRHKKTNSNDSSEIL